ncbi:MAG: HNH endonuclease [Lachnospiraceae bacterium]|nr:HNH endonuclease [Lachnospiraceae bacterium]
MASNQSNSFDTDILFSQLRRAFSFLKVSELSCIGLPVGTARDPFCELCFQREIIVPTEEIHHKKPLSEGGTHDRNNLIAPCKSCHATIHAKRGDYWGQRAPAKPASWEEDEQ